MIESTKEIEFASRAFPVPLAVIGAEFDHFKCTELIAEQAAIDIAELKSE